jgi:predicted DNA binding CopG/RHH family protein
MEERKYTLEEQEILKELELEEAQYKSIDYIAAENQENVKADFRAIVEANIKQKKVINIRPLEADIIKIKSKALSKGIPYQTLINSIIHQFANDKLIEVR